MFCSVSQIERAIKPILERPKFILWHNALVLDIPLGHWKCTFWKTQNNGRMHGTVGRADEQRCVCGNPGFTGGQSLETRSFGSSELRSPATASETNLPHSGPNSPKLDPLTGEILNPLSGSPTTLPSTNFVGFWHFFSQATLINLFQKRSLYALVSLVETRNDNR